MAQMIPMWPAAKKKQHGEYSTKGDQKIDRKSNYINSRRTEDIFNLTKQINPEAPWCLLSQITSNYERMQDQVNCYTIFHNSAVKFWWYAWYKNKEVSYENTHAFFFFYISILQTSLNTKYYSGQIQRFAIWRKRNEGASMGKKKQNSFRFEMLSDRFRQF